MRHRKRKDGRGGTKRREFEECRAESQVCARIRENRDGRRWREIRNPPVRRPSSTRINFGGERVIKAVAGRGKKFTSPSPGLDLPLAHANSVPAIRYGKPCTYSYVRVVHVGRLACARGTRDDQMT